MDGPFSGSFFEDLDDPYIYAVTSSSPSEDSYASNCIPDDLVDTIHIKTCMSDLFTSLFLSNLIYHSMSKEKHTLQDQFDTLKPLVQKSTLSQWGNLDLAKLTIDEVFGKTMQREEEVFHKHPSADSDDFLFLYNHERQNLHAVATQMLQLNNMYAESIEGKT